MTFVCAAVFSGHDGHLNLGYKIALLSFGAVSSRPTAAISSFSAIASVMPVTPKSGHRHSKPFGGKPYGILKSYKSHVLKTKAEETQRSHLEQFKMPTLIHVGNVCSHSLAVSVHRAQYLSSFVLILPSSTSRSISLVAGSWSAHRSRSLKAVSRMYTSLLLAMIRTTHSRIFAVLLSSFQTLKECKRHWNCMGLS